MIPHPGDWKPRRCPECGQMTYEWRAEVFGTLYNLGMFYCTDSDCQASYEKWCEFIRPKNKPDLGGGG